MTTLSRKKLMFYGLLTVAAVVGLVVDRLRFSPASAKGEMAAPAVSTVIVSPDKGSVSDETAGPGIALLFKAESGEPGAAQDGSIRDAFTASPEMEQYYGRKPIRRGGSDPGGEASDEEPADAEDFVEKHVLQATSVQKRGAWALIDGRVLRMGDNLDGHTLRRIDHYRVVFERDGQSLDLKLPEALEAKVPEPKPR